MSLLGRILGCTLLCSVLWLFAVWPPPLWYRTHWPNQTAFMALRRHEVPTPQPAGKDGYRVQYLPIPLDSIARSMQEAVLIGEDNNFWTHGGIDFIAVRHALGYRRTSFEWTSARDRGELLQLLPHVWTRRSALRGASTITQQLAKNLYLSPSRNPLRKLKEAVTAYRLELALDKSRILELYLNVVELGEGVWGVEAASRKYYHRPASALTAGQAAALAGALPFPLSSNPSYRPSRMRWRQNLILRRLRGEPVEVPQIEAEERPPDSILALPDSLADIPEPDSLELDSIVPAPRLEDVMAPAAAEDSLPR